MAHRAAHHLHHIPQWRLPRSLLAHPKSHVSLCYPKSPPLNSQPSLGPSPCFVTLDTACFLHLQSQRWSWRGLWLHFWDVAAQYQCQAGTSTRDGWDRRFGDQGLLDVEIVYSIITYLYICINRQDVSRRGIPRCGLNLGWEARGTEILIECRVLAGFLLFFWQSGTWVAMLSSMNLPCFRPVVFQKQPCFHSIPSLSQVCP